MTTRSKRTLQSLSIVIAAALGTAPSAHAQGMVGATGYEVGPSYQYTHSPQSVSAAAPAAQGGGIGMLILGLGLAAGAVAGLAGGGGGGGDDEASSSPKDPTPKNPKPADPTPAKPEPTPEPAPVDPEPEAPDETQDVPSQGTPGFGGDPDVPPMSPIDPVFPKDPVDPVDPDPVDEADAFRTSEFKRNYGLDLINAERRYAAGATGKGSLVAVYDTGAKIDHFDLAPNIDHTLSYNYFTNDGSMSDADGHGTHVASIIAGAKNERGTHGVAYEASLMILKGLPDGSSSTDREINGLTTFADAQRRAASAGAIAINHSWSFTDPNGNTRFIDEYRSASDLRNYYGNDLITAIETSAAAGLVSVFATANDSHSAPSVNAGAAIYMSDVVKNHTIAVTAIDQNDNIADFANHCGVARDFCLAAPGVSIHGAGIDRDTVIYSGTSNAAPHVSGAVALLKSNFPELTGGEITKILFETARDAGAVGTDNVFGRGILDLENAVAPQGSVSILATNSINGRKYDLAESGVTATGAVASALKSSLSGQTIMVSDSYDRGYGMKLSSLVEDDQRSPVATQRVAAFAQGAGAGSLDLDASRQIRSSSASDWADEAALTQPYAGLVDTSRLTYIEDFGGYEMSLSGARDDDGASFAAAGLKLKSGNTAFRMEVGSVVEKGQMLGADVMGGLGSDMETRTNFASLGIDLAISSDTDLVLAGAIGKSSFDSDGIFKSGRDITTSSIGLGLARGDVFSHNDKLTIGVSRSLSIDGGQIALDMPVAMKASTGGQRSQSVIREAAYVDMESASAPTDIQFGYSHDAGPGRIAVGGLWRPGEDGGSAAISAGYTFTF